MMIFKQAAAGASALALDNTAAATSLPATDSAQYLPNHRPRGRETRANDVEHSQTRSHPYHTSEVSTGNHHTRRYHRPVPTDQIRSHAWRTRRAELQHRINQGGIHCWRCGQPIPPNQPKAWELGHTRDRAFGGTITETLPECQPCNSGAGGRLGAARRWAPTPLPSRAL